MFKIKHYHCILVFFLALAAFNIASADTVNPQGRARAMPWIPLLLLGEEDVDSQAPVIALAKSNVSFTATEGSGSPIAQTVSVTNSGGGTLTGLDRSITYGSGQPTGWLASTFSTNHRARDVNPSRHNG